MREIVDFAEVIHTHFDHCITVRGTQPQQRQRHADVVVQITFCREHRFCRTGFDAQDGGEHFLHGGFAVTAGHGDQGNVETIAPSGRELA